MSYSWYRVDSAAADHPKVMELATLIGGEIALADGYVMRLWSWAQRYAPDGEFPARAVPQLEMYLGRTGVIKLMTEVGLVDARGDAFLVHDWSEMQGALVEKASRDAKMKRMARRQNGARRKSAVHGAGSADGARAAPARDETRRDVTDDTERTNETRGAPRSATLAPGPEDLMQVWNGEADKRLPRCIELNDERRRRARERLGERSLPVWRQVVQRINASSFCCGKNDRGWVATFDWLLQPDVALKVLEGKYDDRDKTAATRDEPRMYPEGQVRL